ERLVNAPGEIELRRGESRGPARKTNGAAHRLQRPTGYSAIDDVIRELAVRRQLRAHELQRRAGVQRMGAMILADGADQLLDERRDNRTTVHPRADSNDVIPLREESGHRDGRDAQPDRKRVWI